MLRAARRKGMWAYRSGEIVAMPLGTLCAQRPSSKLYLGAPPPLRPPLAASPALLARRSRIVASREQRRAPDIATGTQAVFAMHALFQGLYLRGLPHWGSHGAAWISSWMSIHSFFRTVRRHAVAGAAQHPTKTHAASTLVLARVTGKWAPGVLVAALVAKACKRGKCGAHLQTPSEAATSLENQDLPNLAAANVARGIRMFRRKATGALVTIVADQAFSTRGLAVPVQRHVRRETASARPWRSRGPSAGNAIE